MPFVRQAVAEASSLDTVAASRPTTTSDLSARSVTTGAGNKAAVWANGVVGGQVQSPTRRR